MDGRKKSKRYYLTTAIDYVNGRPHIGHALEKIQADVLARYQRAKGDEVFFLTGTDEHGLKIFRAAEAAKKSARDFVDENAENFRRLKEVLNLSWNDFIRTSDEKKHWPGAWKLWNKLHASGDLYKKKYQGLYCVGHEAFMTEKDLVNGLCPDHQKEPEKVEQENWFFRLSKYQEEIKDAIVTERLKIVPESRKNEILSFISSGLEDVSFSRPKKELPWGIPVPHDPEQNMYVWCDALANYLTAIGYAEEKQEFKKWWPADMQVIGKDILRFHAAIWPGMLLSAGLPLPQAIFVHGFITVEGQKMSKTVGNVIAPEELVKKYGVDAVRYYFLREIPAYEDGDFSVKKFEERYNGDLANGLGNLVARVSAVGEKLGELEFSYPQDLEEEIKKVTADIHTTYTGFMENIRLNEALTAVWSLISLADKYINEKEPWQINDREELKKVVLNSSYLIHQVAILLQPFLPETAEKIKGMVKFADGKLSIRKRAHLFLRLE